MVLSCLCVLVVMLGVGDVARAAENLRASAVCHLCQSG